MKQAFLKAVHPKRLTYHPDSKISNPAKKLNNLKDRNVMLNSVMKKFEII
jgi:hypothetical protein